MGLNSDLRLSQRDLCHRVLIEANSGEIDPATGLVRAGSDGFNPLVKVEGIVGGAVLFVFRHIATHQPRWFMHRFEYTYPADAEDVVYDGPGAVFPEPVMRISLVEDMSGTEPLRLDPVDWYDRHARSSWADPEVLVSQYQYAVAGGRLAVFGLNGAPSGSVALRVSYVQTPYAVDRDSGVPHPDVPGWMQDAVIRKAVVDLLTTERAVGDDHRARLEEALAGVTAQAGMGPAAGAEYGRYVELW